MSSEVPECPTCGRNDFESKRGMKSHHARTHGESLNSTTYTCEVCGDSFEARADQSRVTCSEECLGTWRAENLTDETFSDQELLDELRRLESEHDGAVTISLMDEAGAYGSSTYSKRFGSWNEALRRAGIEPSKQPNTPDEELLSELTRVAEEVGRTPTTRDIRDHADFSLSAYVRRWGSVPQTREAAGLSREIKPDKVYSEQELLNELQQVADQVGHSPSQLDMTELGDISPRTYRLRFGSWTDALNAAGMESRYPLSGQESPHWTGGKSVYDAVKQLLSNWNQARREHRENLCKMCGATEDLHLHHIIPIMAGGTNEGWNLMTLCESCHKTVEIHTKQFTDSVLVE